MFTCVQWKKWSILNMLIVMLVFMKNKFTLFFKYINFVLKFLWLMCVCAVLKTVNGWLEIISKVSSEISAITTIKLVNYPIWFSPPCQKKPWKHELLDGKYVKKVDKNLTVLIPNLLTTNILLRVQCMCAVLHPCETGNVLLSILQKNILKKISKKWVCPWLRFCYAYKFLSS